MTVGVSIVDVRKIKLTDDFIFHGYEYDPATAWDLVILVPATANSVCVRHTRKHVIHTDVMKL